MKEVLKKKTLPLFSLKDFPLTRLYTVLSLFFILVLGFILRAYNLTSLPMYGDELTIVYDSYSILKTGMDQTGEKLPLVFEMGAGRLGGYIYGSLPFVYLFGPTELGVRSLSFLSGLGLIIVIYFLATKLFKNKEVALFSSFLMAISPWGIYLSRAGFEAHFALFLTLLGVTLFLYKKYILSSVLFGLTIFTYPTFKLTLPLLIALLVFFSGFKETIKSKLFYVFATILIVFASVSVYESFKGLSEARFLSLNVFSDAGLKESIIQKINEERTISNLPEVVKPIVFNRPLNYSRILLEKYLENLSLDFLYLRGDRNPRHNPGEWGMNYLVELPLLFVGLYFLFIKNTKVFWLITSWILITPLATMFMGQTHALRDDLMMPAFILVSSFAIYNLKDIKFKVFVISLMLLQLVFILIRVYFYAPNKFASFWSKDAYYVSRIVDLVKGSYEKVIVSKKIDNIEYAYPVYSTIDPSVVINQYNSKDKVYGNVVITDNLDEFRNNKKYLIVEDTK